MPVPRRQLARLASWVAVRSGAARVKRARRHLRNDYVVHVLAYHEIAGSVAEEREGVVSAPRLASHLKALAQDFRIATLSDAVAALRSPEGLREDLACITFDDGYLGNYRWAWPLLREHRVPATIFVTTGFVDGAELWFDLARRFFDACAFDGAAGARAALPRVATALNLATLPTRSADALALLKGLTASRREAALAEMRSVADLLEPGLRPLDWTQVRELASAGIEIGCHTVTHPILSSLTSEFQRVEIVRSRDRISEQLGTAPRLFAYPNGSEHDFDERTVEILRNEGFVAACTTSRGPNRAGADFYRLKRISVGNDPPELLTARLSGLFDDEMRAYLPASIRHVH